MLDFSVIIPTYQRQSQLAACLESLLLMEYDPDLWEVLVVDDGSDTPPEEAVNRVRRRLKIRLLCRSHAGPASARNAGAADAGGRYLIFTDDDCRPSPGWLRALAMQFSVDENCIIGGRTLNAVDDNIYSAASQMLLDYLYSYFNAEPTNAKMLASNNLAVPAAIFHSAGGFDTSFPNAAAEDRELCDRLKHLGYRLVYAPDAIVMHHHELSLRRFWRQHYNYGTGAFRYHRVRASRTRDRIRVESARYYWNLLRYPASACRDHVVVLTTLMAISQIANAAGFFKQRFAHSLPGHQA